MNPGTIDECDCNVKYEGDAERQVYGGYNALVVYNISGS